MQMTYENSTAFIDAFPVTASDPNFRELNADEIEAVAGGPVPILVGLAVLGAVGGGFAWGYEQGYKEGADRAERDNQGG